MPALRTRRVAMIGIVAALSFVMGLIGWTAPSGGRVSLADLPVLMLALSEGWGPGVVAGAVAGVLHYPQQPVTLHPLSFILDYPLSGACLGLAGLLASPAASRIRITAAVVLAVGAKYLAHVLSGVLFWSQGVEGWAAWTLSLTYNATYMAPMLLIDLLALVPMARRLRRLDRRS